MDVLGGAKLLAERLGRQTADGPEHTTEPVAELREEDAIPLHYWLAAVAGARSRELRGSRAGVAVDAQDALASG